MADYLDQKINQYFSGRVVRKDLTQLMKSGANVPTFVLEYLLGMYCATDDQDVIDSGITKVKEILDNNFMRFDESNLVKARIREQGYYTIIDKISAELNPQYDIYEARFTNLDIGKFELSPDYINKYEKILTGGIWVIAKLSYVHVNARDPFDNDFETNKKAKRSKYVESLDTPFRIESLKPIQMPDIDYNEIIEFRNEFTLDEWIDVLMRSCGFEPRDMSKKEKMHLLLRVVPLVERNYNLVELGPRSTGKSYLYKEISPYSILVSGGYSTAANMFYNISSRRIGLVGLWDVVAFDEVAGMKYKELDGIQIMKDYMTSGSFTRGRESINADASLVFIGNINDKPEVLLKISHLFDPFPEEFNNDSAFFDRIHNYLPGWEVPKLRASLFTDNFGFITDYLSEFLKAMRKKDYTGLLDTYFTLNRDVNKRDEIAIRKTVSGLMKMLFPNNQFSKEELQEVLIYAVEGRRRVKEQLKKMAGDEFSAVNLGFIDNESKEEVIVYTTEQPKGSIIANTRMVPGHVFCVGTGYTSELTAIFKLENKMVNGEGKFKTEGIGNANPVKECFHASWVHFKEKIQDLLPHPRLDVRDYLMSFIDPQGRDISDNISLGEFIGLCSITLDKPVQEGLAIVGHYNLAGSLSEIPKLPDVFRVAKNAGANKLLLPLSTAGSMGEVPHEYLSVITPIFYSSLVDAAKKAMNL